MKRCVGLFALVAFAAGAQEVTFGGLLDEMIDLGALAEFPDPAYTCNQFSSYDRNSTDPLIGTDENWFANGDRGQHIRKEERNGAEEWVMMDIDGPGALVRIWSANPEDAGVLRIYLDHNPEPAIEMPLIALLRGETAPFIAPIAGERSRGWNSFLPIPYATHCKVTASERDFYYQVNYRSYEPGTTVRTFTMEEARAHDSDVGRIATFLTNLGQRGFADPAMADYTSLAHGASMEQVGSWDSPQAITRFAAHVKADDMEAALRGCLLEIYFDDYDLPFVAVPLGDFFGSAPGINPYTALPSGVMDDGVMYSLWVMPYRKRATVRVTNYSGAPAEVALELTKSDYRWTDNTMYFHADWRSEADIPTQPRQDWNFFIAAGKGRYVGNMLHITNPVVSWWGEGDEKIYVDHESFPSTFGTGTEDYYGYAWCCPDTFTHAYHAQPRSDGPGNFGQTCNARYHVLDSIPFTSSFRFDMEVWHWTPCEVTQAATSYWYGAPGSSSNLGVPKPADLVVEPVPELPKGKEGAIEGEDMRLIAHGGGSVMDQGGIVADWSGLTQLWWIDAEPGDKLDLGLPVETAGQYDVRVRMTRAHDYGIFQTYINGEKIGEPIDLYGTGVTGTDEILLGTVSLPAGEAVMTFEVTGKNEHAAPRHMLGLDYVMLEKK